MNNKRVFRLILMTIALLLPLLFFHSCGFFGITIEERIQSFEDDLNLIDRSDAYLNFHPSLTTDYDEIKNPAYRFNPVFPNNMTYIPYTITIIDDSAAIAVTGTINSSGWGGDRAITFKMALDGIDWMIEEIPYLYGYVSGKVID